MKKIILSLLCVSLFSGIFAQSFSLKDTNGVAITSGGTIQFMGDPTLETIYAFVNITNNSDVAKSVKVKKVIHEGDTIPGTANTFCWGLCYPDTTYISPYPQTIQAGSTSEGFSGDYSPKGIAGISRITYVFFDVDNRNDSVSVVVEFNASPSYISDNLTGLVKISAAYPNPAINVVYADYTLPETVNRASIVITNMMGSKVKEISLYERSGKARIAVSDLVNGIYFYSLKADDQLILTRKFIVKR
jgi:hypothetical protein